MTLRVAFIGAGQMARHHLAAIERSKIGTIIVGVHDRAADRAEELATAAWSRPFTSIRALLAEARPDVVHVCTPPEAHFDAAAEALRAGAHVYVEKPFAMTTADALALVELAQARGRVICGGHQLLFDPAFTSMMSRARELGTLVQADSHFTFRPVGQAALQPHPSVLARQLIDILPHPLYSLVSVLEREAGLDPVALTWADAGPEDVQAILKAGGAIGRLSVSLRARPIASWLTLTGTRGSLTTDFVRSITVGAANPGTEPLEKIGNPMLEAAQLASRTTVSLGRRLRAATGFPGLVEIINSFYAAAALAGPQPTPFSHLLAVTRIFEDLTARIQASLPARRSVTVTVPDRHEHLVAVTGARGFLGSEIVRALGQARGIGRGAAPPTFESSDWISADLGVGLTPEMLAGVDVVVHAAAETAGGYSSHQRNTVQATRNLLRTMKEAGVKRLVLVSSLSVLQPPKTPWETQDERTPRIPEPLPFGPYAWGKTVQEDLVEREAGALGIATRIVRPGALTTRTDPSLPGLMGRRLFGRWHLGLGRPGLPIAVCDVTRCAEVIAWCAQNFDAAPLVMNLLDPAVATRRDFIRQLRAGGWRGRMVWVPISALAFGVTAARTVLSLGHGRLPDRLAVWSILRPRRYDTRVAAAILGATREAAPLAHSTEVVLNPQ